MKRLKDVLVIVGLVVLIGLALVFGAKRWAARLAAEIDRRNALDAIAKDHDAKVEEAEVKHDAAVARVDARLEQNLQRDTVDVGHELAVEQWRKEHPEK